MVTGDLVTGLNMQPLMEVEDEGGLLTEELEPQLEQGNQISSKFLSMQQKIRRRNKSTSKKSFELDFLIKREFIVLFMIHCTY